MRIRERLIRDTMRDAESLVRTFQAHYPETGLDFAVSESMILVFRDERLVFTWNVYEGLRPLVDFLKSQKR